MHTHTAHTCTRTPPAAHTHHAHVHTHTPLAHQHDMRKTTRMCAHTNIPTTHAHSTSTSHRHMPIHRAAVRNSSKHVAYASLLTLHSMLNRSKHMPLVMLPRAHLRSTHGSADLHTKRPPADAVTRPAVLVRINRVKHSRSYVTYAVAMNLLTTPAAAAAGATALCCTNCSCLSLP